MTLIRYNEDGSLDAAFGENGIATLDVQLGSEDIAYDLAIQNDGKIVVAGSSDNGPDKDAFVVRFNTDGALDIDFGSGGITLTDFDGGLSDEIRVIKIHALTGNIIVGGSAIISSALAKLWSLVIFPRENWILHSNRTEFGYCGSLV
ncbi:MAG: putative delta-60 repeat protein [Flavobacteriales bacterium]